MKKTIAAAALPLFLAACAAGNGGPSATRVATAPAKGTAYCWKERLVTDGDALSCNWAGSVREACDSMALSTMKKSALASGPDRGTLCPNGQWLVMVTTK